MPGSIAAFLRGYVRPRGTASPWSGGKGYAEANSSVGKYLRIRAHADAAEYAEHAPSLGSRHEN
jgi:hypothetical protein